MSVPKCPISGYEFAPFGCWYGLECAIKDKVTLFYQAPLDAAPRPVFVIKSFKNRKIRVVGGEATFTADQSHLDRFYYLEKKA